MGDFITYTKLLRFYLYHLDLKNSNTVTVRISICSFEGIINVFCQLAIEMCKVNFILIPLSKHEGQISTAYQTLCNILAGPFATQAKQSAFYWILRSEIAEELHDLKHAAACFDMAAQHYSQGKGHDINAISDFSLSKKKKKAILDVAIAFRAFKNRHLQFSGATSSTCSNDDKAQTNNNNDNGDTKNDNRVQDVSCTSPAIEFSFMQGENGNGDENENNKITNPCNNRSVFNNNEHMSSCKSVGRGQEVLRLNESELSAIDANSVISEMSLGSSLSPFFSSTHHNDAPSDPFKDSLNHSTNAQSNKVSATPLTDQLFNAFAKSTTRVTRTNKSDKAVRDDVEQKNTSKLSASHTVPEKSDNRFSSLPKYSSQKKISLRTCDENNVLETTLTGNGDFATDNIADNTKHFKPYTPRNAHILVTPQANLGGIFTLTYLFILLNLSSTDNRAAERQNRKNKFFSDKKFYKGLKLFLALPL
ncbi:hypothetical protein RFI_12942 [Reticulomyxa filosa]|uniref:Uncharacterized protein n=1 Tax=Reticulomyxa filosa TaxID=46433 RepID=X6NE12_RETFI|nr:hypothetical protein RFI_12942 [Reticulomyxa filosa]|eukprot:ETO24221.1 hypothetical protein RFI_12942 [Reticulomyxa filosa]